MTIQSPGSSSTESGSVSFNGSTDVTSNTGVIASGGTVSFGTVKTGASQTLTRTLGEVGITSADELAIVLNASEPSGNAITLTGLEVTIFQGGSTVFTADLASSQLFSSTFTGTGNQGFVFTLDAAETVELDAILAGFTSAQVAALRLGLSASASGATGGVETFNLSRLLVGQPVPEAATLLLLGSALVGLAAYGRRRLPK